MEDDTVVRLPRPGASVKDDPLLEVLRSGARRMLQQVIESEVESFLSAHADQEGVTDAYACRLLPLTCLAPNMVEAILDGRQPKGLRLVDMLGMGRWVGRGSVAPSTSDAHLSPRCAGAGRWRRVAAPDPHPVAHPSSFARPRPKTFGLRSLSYQRPRSTGDIAKRLTPEPRGVVPLSLWIQAPQFVHIHTPGRIREVCGGQLQNDLPGSIAIP
jgi:hypothetical protein